MQQGETILATYTFKISLSPRADKLLSALILLYRRLQYGYAFRRIRLTRGKFAILDHINHNGLDNRKKNLRIVTPQQNSWNTRSHRSYGKSKYKGVSRDKDKQKWRANIYIESKLKHLGYFENEKEAATVYDTAAEKHRGEYAFLNFGRD